MSLPAFTERHTPFKSLKFAAKILPQTPPLPPSYRDAAARPEEVTTGGLPPRCHERMTKSSATPQPADRVTDMSF
ncbi:hypothetical protein ACI65C_006654 [Semiaphis heraclei]